MIHDVLTSVNWSLVGFIAGWLAAHEMSFINRTLEATVSVAKREKPDHAETPGRSRVLGWVVVVLAVVTVAQGSYFTYESSKTAQKNTERTECQAQFNKDFAAVLVKRAQWADDDKKALNKLLRDLLAVTKPGQSGQILVTYLATTDRTDKLRAETPLPKLEDRGC